MDSLNMEAPCYCSKGMPHPPQSSVVSPKSNLWVLESSGILVALFWRYLPKTCFKLVGPFLH